jgi:hypothetical protein
MDFLIIFAIFLYIYLFLKYIYIYILSNSITIQFLALSFLMIFLTFINLYYDRLSNKMQDICKFSGHVMFISVLLSLLYYIFSLLCGIIFYFGFINTIIFLNIAGMLLVSGLVNSFKCEFIDCLSKSNVGRKILELMNYYYNTYIISKKIYEKSISLTNHIFKKYILAYTKIIFDKFKNINDYLSNNEQSRMIKNKIKEQCLITKDYFMEQILQPYLLRSFQNALEKDPFFESGEILNTGLENKHKILSKKNFNCIMDNNQSDIDISKNFGKRSKKDKLNKKYLTIKKKEDDKKINSDKQPKRSNVNIYYDVHRAIDLMNENLEIMNENLEIMEQDK